MVEALVLSTVITLLVSRRLLDAVHHRLKRHSHRILQGRWASMLAISARDILLLLMMPVRTARALARRLEPRLLHEATDPNLSRLLLLERVGRGAAWTR